MGREIPTAGFRRRLMAAAIGGLLGASAAPTLATERHPFLGEWDCQVAVFWFTPHGYDNGFDILPIRKVTKSKGGWSLGFDKGYRISLFDVTGQTMTWHSPMSGDTFHCKRLGPPQ